MVLTWSQPKDTGLGGVLFYKVSYQDITGTSHNMNTNITYHNVTGLSPNTTYTMTVMADNGIAGKEENRSLSVSVTTATGNAITTGIHLYMYIVMYIAGLTWRWLFFIYFNGYSM